jgi:hypothetical protein
MGSIFALPPQEALESLDHVQERLEGLEGNPAPREGAGEAALREYQVCGLRGAEIRDLSIADMNAEGPEMQAPMMLNEHPLAESRPAAAIGIPGTRTDPPHVALEPQRVGGIFEGNPVNGLKPVEVVVEAIG